MKFLIFVEGQTEKHVLGQFFKRWLEERLDQPVKIDVVPFKGWAELKKDAPKKAMLHLNTPKNRNQLTIIISLMDFYGPEIYPHSKFTVEEKSNWLKSEIERAVNQRGRFFQYFAIHETEAWLLSDPNIFPSGIAKAIRRNVKSPESLISPEHPSAYLDTLYKSHLHREYAKKTDGDYLFAKLDPEVAASKCPYLKAMLDDMLTMAQQDGQ